MYRLPDDINDKTGVMFESKSNAPEENLFFAGVYQIVKIESKITNGQFLQTLTCVRLNNQNGAGEPLFEVMTQAGDKLVKSVSKEDNIMRRPEPDFLKKGKNGNYIFGGKAINDRKKYFAIKDGIQQAEDDQ